LILLEALSVASKMSLRLCVLLLGLVALSSSLRTKSDLKVMFDKFMVDFEKTYSSDEELSKRFHIFSSNVLSMNIHNNLRTSTWKKGINQFSDLTEEEFKKIHLNGYVNMLKSGGVVGRSSNQKIDTSALPESVDWREKGAITEPKNQGYCGSCWAFATVEQVESYVQINTGELKDLSHQHVTSCTPNTLHCGGTGGCYGSIPQLGYSYIQLFGLATEEDYPYVSGTSGSSGSCDYDPKDTPSYATIRGFESLPRNDQDTIMDHLANKGPLAIAVDASLWSSYSGGVFDSCRFDKNIVLNHAVQMVGYGTDPKEGDFWIIRNSWGKRWGEGGFMRLKRTKEVECGTDSTPLSGVACEGDGQDTQHVCGQCGVLFDTNYPIGATKA